MRDGKKENKKCFLRRTGGVEMTNEIWIMESVATDDLHETHDDRD